MGLVQSSLLVQPDRVLGPSFGRSLTMSSAERLEVTLAEALVPLAPIHVPLPSRSLGRFDLGCQSLCVALSSSSDNQPTEKFVNVTAAERRLQHRLVRRCGEPISFIL